MKHLIIIGVGGFAREVYWHAQDSLGYGNEWDLKGFLDGDIKGAAAMQFKSLRLVDALFSEVNPIPVKHAMKLLGKDVGPLRPPLCEMEPEHLKELEAAMKEFGLI